MNQFLCQASLSAFVLWFLMISTDAKYSKQYSLPGKYCGRSAKEIDGAVLYSSDNMLYANSGCVLKFKADDDFITSKRIMVHFENLSISDCGVKLSVYYDDDSYGEPDQVYDCNTNTPSVLYTSGKYLTLRLDKTTTRGYSFKIVLTTFKQKTSCSEFQCGEDNGYCIDDDLYCDSVKHCLDGRDEFNCTSVEEIVELGYKAMIGVVITMLLICGGCIALVYFLCKRRRASSGTVIRTQPPMTLVNQPQGAPPPAVNQPPPGTYPTQPVYPTQPAYGAAYPPPQQPQYPPPQQAYPPPQAYPPAQPPPAYSDNPYTDQPQAPYPPQVATAPPPPFNPQVNYSADQEKVQLP